MKRYVIVHEGEVVNVAISEGPRNDNWIASDEAGIGWKHKDGELLKPAEADNSSGGGGGPVEPP